MHRCSLAKLFLSPCPQTPSTEIYYSVPCIHNSGPIEGLGWGGSWVEGGQKGRKWETYVILSMIK